MISDDKLYEMKANVEQQYTIKEILKKAEKEAYLDDSEFAALLREWLISPTGYVIDTGCGGNVNAAVALRLADEIEKHPIMWKCFFRVA